MMNLKEWKTNVIAYNEQLNEELQKKDKAKELYYGFEVIDGKLIENPEILFIGINPGRGDENEDYKISFETERISYLDVFNEDYRDDYPNTYHLAEKMIRFFKLMEWPDEQIIDLLTNKAVKTNFYHIATDNKSDIITALNVLDKDLKHSYFKQSAAFTMQLIDIIKPKLVILEGKTVYDAIIVECCEQHNLWNENKFGAYFDKKLNTQFIGFDRTFSIENRAVFVDKLKELLES